jgi:galactokinase
MADESAVAMRLAARGLSEAAARQKAGLFARAAGALASEGAAGGAAARAFFVPGRIEVLGKHTDYAGGRSLIAAAERGFCLVAVARAGALVRARALDLGERCEFPFAGDLEPRVGHWSNYPMTVARRVARNFPGRLRGADLAFASDLPSAAGMSSSSALVVACFLALAAINRLAEREVYRRNIAGPESLAGYLGTVENGQTFAALAGDRGVGTFGGSEDHTAMLCSQAGTLAQYSYCPVRLERRIAMPAGYVFAIAASGIAAEKTGSAMERYNRASRLAAAAAGRWREATGRPDGTVAAAMASGPAARATPFRVPAAAGTYDPAAAARMREVLAGVPPGGEFTPQELRDRFEHFRVESDEIIPPAGDALAAGDLATFGRLADRSQEAAETLLGNQVPETSHLARSARELGAAAASAFGAGFGGSIWALVREDDGAAFLEKWPRRYAAAFASAASRAAFFVTGAGPAAFEL